MNKESLVNYLNNVSKGEAIDFLHSTIKDLKKYNKQREKAVNKEINDWLTNRARSTTNYSNSYNATRMYNKTLQLLTESILEFNKIH